LSTSETDSPVICMAWRAPLFVPDMIFSVPGNVLAEFYLMGTLSINCAPAGFKYGPSCGDLLDHHSGIDHVIDRSYVRCSAVDVPLKMRRLSYARFTIEVTKRKFPLFFRKLSRG